MSKSVSFVLFLVFLAASSVVYMQPTRAGSKTIVVPDDYPTIQAAVGHAFAGDTVLVRRGTYQGGIVIDKSISLIGEDMSNTVISGGVVMNSLSAKTPKKSVQTLALAAGVSEARFAPCNFMIPKTTVVYVNSSDVTISCLKITGGDNHLVARGDRIQISAINSGMNLVGSYETVVNSLGAIAVSGSFGSITRNNVSAITISGSHNVISDNIAGSAKVESTVAWRIDINGDSNFISNNTALNGQVGISVGGSGNTISGNCVEGNYFMGIHVHTCNNSIFFNNYVANNKGQWDGWGISLSGTRYHAENNIFYYNTFMNNSRDFRVEAPSFHNYWDNGTVGNYWGDYPAKYPNSADLDGSGTGKTPYVLDEINVDYHPLMSPVNLSIPIFQGPFYYTGSLATPVPWQTDPSTPTPPSSPSPNSSPTQTPNPTPSPSLGPRSSPSPTPQQSEPFPTALAATASVASATTVGVGLIVYFKKRNRGQTT